MRCVNFSWLSTQNKVLKLKHPKPVQMKKISILVAIFLLSCGGKNSEPLFLIPTLHLSPGETIQLDMSLYKQLPDVSLKFTHNPMIEVVYSPENDTLLISANEKTQPITIVPFQANGKKVELVFRLKKLVKHTFIYKPTQRDTQVVVMGGFNDWSRNQLVLDDTDHDGLLEKAVYLEPAKHDYKFVVDHQELIDPQNPVFVSNNIGGWNSVLDLSVFRDLPSGHILKESENEEELQFTYEAPADSARLKHIYIFFNNASLQPDQYLLQNNEIIVFKKGLVTGRLRIIAVDELDRVLTENHTEIIDGKVLNITNHPDSWYFSVLYNILVDRFHDGDATNNQPIIDYELHPYFNFMGGDIDGVIQKLNESYFKNLNVSCIWLSPLQKQPDKSYTEFVEPGRKVSGYHGYWPIAPREIDDRFGTRDEFSQLVKNAHQNEIKILLDFVSNHTHEDHPYFLNNRAWYGNIDLPDGRKNIRLWGEETRLTTWFDTFLPSFDYLNNPQAIDQVTEDAVWWLTTYDLDGFRQDAVKHVPHGFWKTLTSKMNDLESEKAFYQIGETFGSDQLIRSYVNPGELDAQFNFAIYFNAREQFSREQANFSQLSDVLRNNLIAFNPLHLMGNITSSHDQVRFMAFADGQLSFNDHGTERSFNNPPKDVDHLTSYGKLQNFHAFNMALPGIPVIYYGEEIGMTGAGDPDNRRMMRFDGQLNQSEKENMAVISDLNRLRKQYTALAIGDLKIISAEGPQLVLLKKYFDEEILLLINQDQQSAKIDLDPRFNYELIYSTQLNNKLDKADAVLNGYSSMFLKRM